MFRHLKDFLTENANKINKHAKAMADKSAVRFSIWRFLLERKTWRERWPRKKGSNEA